MLILPPEPLTETYERTTTMYDTITWSDIAHQDQHGHRPDNGQSAEELYEYYGDDLVYEPEHVREVEQLVAEDRLVRENERLRGLLCAHDIDH